MRIANLLLHDLPGQLPPDHRRDWVPGGYLGTAATIERMREFVTEYKRNFEIRKLAAKIIANCPAKDYFCYAKALYEFCRDRVKYVYDPHMVELVESPLKVLEAGIADCDSVCTLLASLNESIGLKTRFRTIKADAKRPTDFSHVYCVVRIPQSRFSASRVTGWVAEDATLPDKQFGWEPPGQFEKKDWAASKDKDGEDGDDPLLGEYTMTPINESQAQMEIDQLCQAMNLKLIEAMRKGLEWSDPQKANVLAIVVGRFSQLSSGGGSPSARLQAVRNGYAYWSPILDDASAAIPDFGVTPNLSGYSVMNGLGAEPAKVPDETYISRYKTYINTVEWKLKNLINSGAEQKYPAEVSNIRIKLYEMRNAESKAATVGAEATERVIYKLYVPAVDAETKLAQKLVMKYPEGTFSSPAEQERSWWDIILQPATSALIPLSTTGGGIPEAKPTPMEQMLTKPDVAPKITPKTTTGAKAKSVAYTDPNTGKVVMIEVPIPDADYVPQPSIMDTITKNLPIILGVGAALGVLYYLNKRSGGA